MSHVFISYSKKNQDYVQKLVDRLRDEGFDVWIDSSQLRSSENWWRSIVEAIWSCDAFIVVMSPASDKSRWVQREIAVADSSGKPIFPVLLEGDLRTPNWSIFLRTQYEDVRQGQMPDAEFFSTLSAKASRRNERGRDVTTSKLKVADDVETQETLKIHLNNPPPPDIDDSADTLELQRVPAQSDNRMVMWGGIGAAILLIVVIGVFATRQPIPIEPTPTPSPTAEVVEATPVTPEPVEVSEASLLDTVDVLNSWREVNDFDPLVVNEVLDTVANGHVTFLRNEPLSDLGNPNFDAQGRDAQAMAQDADYTGDVVMVAVVADDPVTLGDALDQIALQRGPDSHADYSEVGLGVLEAVNTGKHYFVLILGENTTENQGD